MGDLILKIYCSFIAAKYRYANAILFIVGIMLITSSLSDIAEASEAENIIRKQLCKILALLEGAFGALITVVAGLGAVVTAAMGGYKLAMSCVVVHPVWYCVYFIAVFPQKQTINKLKTKPDVPLCSFVPYRTTTLSYNRVHFVAETVCESER